MGADEASLVAETVEIPDVADLKALKGKLEELMTKYDQSNDEGKDAIHEEIGEKIVRELVLMEGTKLIPEFLRNEVYAVQELVHEYTPKESTLMHNVLETAKGAFDLVMENIRLNSELARSKQLSAKQADLSAGAAGISGTVLQTANLLFDRRNAGQQGG